MNEKGEEEPRKHPKKESQLDIDNFYCTPIPRETTVDEFCIILDKLIDEFKLDQNQQSIIQG